MQCSSRTMHGIGAEPVTCRNNLQPSSLRSLKGVLGCLRGWKLYSTFPLTQDFLSAHRALARKSLNLAEQAQPASAVQPALSVLATFVLASCKLDMALDQRVDASQEAALRASPCPHPHFAAIESSETNDLFHIAGSKRTCVICTPCYACAISIPR
jgi:hypothetical protein